MKKETERRKKESERGEESELHISEGGSGGLLRSLCLPFSSRGMRKSKGIFTESFL